MPGRRKGRKSKTRSFKNKSGYKRWTAYGHMHDVMGNRPKGYRFPKVKIGGKAHKVNHKR